MPGFHSGRFLLKSRVVNPALGEWDGFYTAKDLYVGAILKINAHTFLLTDADDYTFSYMERQEETEKVERADCYPSRFIQIAILFLSFSILIQISGRS